MAAHRYFEDEEIELICCATFEELFEQMARDTKVIGMMAIENTIAGSLLHNYELLRESGLSIVGELKLRISHSIMSAGRQLGRHKGGKLLPLHNADAG